MSDGAPDEDGGVTDAFVVIREAGERTVAAARAICECEVGAANVATIREVPFAAALRRGLELGAEVGRRWTLCLDADVLLAPGAITRLVREAGARAAGGDALLGVSGQVADPLLGQVRHAGNHLYRTAHLPATLASAPFDAAKRRPETVAKKHMARAGHGWINLDGGPIGLHDAEQSFRDIFRKVYIHTLKHARFMGYAERYWSRRAAEDADARIALWSAALARAIAPYAHVPGSREDENVAIDTRRFAGNLDAILVPAGMTEKAPLAVDAVAAAEVADRLASFEVAPEFLAEEPFIRAETRKGWPARLARLRRTSPAGRMLSPLAPFLRRMA